MIRKYLMSVVLILICAGVSADNVQLKKLWQTEPVLKIPESVRYDAGRKVLFVSNVEGENPWADDGGGSIGKIGLDGQVIEVEWVKGLNCPKGMDIMGDYLYVTDKDDVVKINIPEGKIVDRILVPGGGMINDLSIAEDGTIYVTDEQHGNLHKLINGKFTMLVEGKKGMNGVLHTDGELVFVADGGLHVLHDTGTIETIAEGMEGHVDGVERVDKDSWLVSCWLGTVYHVTREGRVTLLLDGRPDEISAADLGYDPVNKIAYFPGFFKNYVAAYQLTLE